MSNVKIFVVSNATSPKIDDSAFIHPFAVIIGDCFIEGKMYQLHLMLFARPEKVF
jgi:carbonic anhydrase/acetyltransferase-like protein (isoleucine patch superfamily)